MKNIAAYLSEIAKKQPDNYAVVVQYMRNNLASDLYKHSYTYKQLDEQSDIVAAGLKAYGIKKGMRTVVMLKPNLDFFVLIFALFKVGAILVAIDPGIGIKNLGKCIKEVKAEAFIGIGIAHFVRVFFGWGKCSVKKTVLVSKFSLLSFLITNLEKIKRQGKKQKSISLDANANDTAAILFTSGSTGVPKGVVYTNANFIAQINILKNLYNIEVGEVELATFPLFAIFSPVLGMTSIIPSMDFTRPGRVKPKIIIDAIIKYKCTSMFGSPALLNRVGRWGEYKKTKLPSLRRVISAGAPVASSILQRYKTMLSEDAQIFTPYGATEALPVSSIGSDELLNQTLTAKGKGVCVGRVVSGLDIKIIKILDIEIPQWKNDLELSANEIGEICVSGEQVTASYYNRERDTKLAKIITENGFYHRMGDLGYLDENACLWFCGRKNQRVVSDKETLYTVCCEGIFNSHSMVFRTALASITIENKRVPVICVEVEKQHKNFNSSTLIEDLKNMAKQNDITKTIDKFLIHPEFPVDIRHNAKINREKLSIWAANILK